MFHRLACWDTTQALNSFEAGCLKPELRIQLPIGISFYRSFAYGGITSSLVLAPFQYFWDSLATNQLIGILFLFLSSLGIKKSFDLNSIGFLLGITWFPIAYSLIHDGGPVRVGFFTASWSPYLVQKYLSARHWAVKAFYAACLSGLWLLSAEDKPYFFYLIPGIIILIAASLHANRIDLNREAAIRAGSLLMTASLLCVALILFARVGNQPYWQYLSTQVKVDRLSTLIHSTRLLIDFPENAERIIQSNFYTKLCSSMSMSAFALASFKAWQIHARNPDQHNRQTMAWLLASVLALWFFGWIAGGRFHHHFVFAQIPILIIFAKCFSMQWRQKSLLLLTILIVMNIFSLGAVASAPKNTYYASSTFMPVLTTAIETSSPGTIVNCSHWGCYYSHSLAGSNGLPVVWANKAESLSSLAKLAKSKAVDILHVCYKCDMKSTDQYYSGFIRGQDMSANGWHVARYKRDNSRS